MERVGEEGFDYCRVGMHTNLRPGLCVLVGNPTLCTLEEMTVDSVCGILDHS